MPRKNMSPEAYAAMREKMRVAHKGRDNSYLGKQETREKMKVSQKERRAAEREERIRKLRDGLDQ